MGVVGPTTRANEPMLRVRTLVSSVTAGESPTKTEARPERDTHRSLYSKRAKMLPEKSVVPAMMSGTDRRLQYVGCCEMARRPTWCAGEGRGGRPVSSASRRL